MKTYLILVAGIILMVLPGCKKFLDAKPDDSLAVPTTIAEAQALLDIYSIMNTTAPNLGAESDDDFYMSNNYFNSTTTNNQDNYLWKKDVVTDGAWNNMYKTVLYANTALATLEKIKVDDQNRFEWERVEASALFQRAVAFYFLVQYFTKPYVAAEASQTPGIPLRLVADVNAPTVRNNLQECYDKIIEDMEYASSRLAAGSSFPSRPTKAAAFGFLARVYHGIERYEEAGRFADSALSINNTLINYNTVSTTAAAPFAQFNAEVTYPFTISGTSRMNTNNSIVDSVLYVSYHSNDLRKALFFKSLSPATGYGFKGNYEGNTSGQLFCGIANNELYLIKAECEARKGNVGLAIATLNSLLIKRFRTNFFVPVTATTQEAALNIILQERKKELVGRGLRWFDLRRLNQDPAYAKTLMRKPNGETTTLLPGSKNYTFYIPQVVIDMSGIEQNERE